jgi:hypothetical protein
MKRIDIAWLVFWGLASSAWCLSAGHELSATFDEPFYLRAGVESWRTGSNRELMKAGTMPLPVDLQCLPIYICERIRGEPFDLDRDFHRLLPFARGMNLAFWWLLLIYAMRLAHRVGGSIAGRFAVLLIATEPSLLGHACLATTDIALTATVLVFAYHYDRGRDGGRFQRWLLPGILYGVAMAAKASALLFVPIVMLALELPRSYRADGGMWKASSGYRFDCWKIFLVGVALVFIYCGSDWQPQPKFEQMAANLPDDGISTPAVRWLTHHAAVFPNAGEAFHYQFKHNVRGHGSYLLGEWQRRAVWYYFPAALSIKLTAPVLALLAGLLIARPRALCTPLGLAALLLLLFSLNCRVQIGVRLVFPLLVFLLLAIAVGLAAVRAPLRKAFASRLTGFLLSLACALAAVSTWPDGLRYGNELWGGSDSTYLYLSDSNSDWGQGIKDLDRWTAEHRLPLAHVWYYGRDPAIASDADRCLPLHMLSACDIRSPADVWQYVRGNVVAVSTTLLYGNPAITESMPIAVEFFRGQQPIGRSRNYFIYDFRE